jgi:hypothetical protein
VFENRMLRRIFGPLEERVTGWCRKFHNEEVRNFYLSPSICLVKENVVCGESSMNEEFDICIKNFNLFIVMKVVIATQMVRCSVVIKVCL